MCIPALIGYDRLTVMLSILASLLVVALGLSASSRAFDALSSERMNTLLGLVNLLLFVDNLALFLFGWVLSWWLISRELVRRDQERRNMGSASATYMANHSIAIIALTGFLGEACYTAWVSSNMSSLSISALGVSPLAGNGFAFTTVLIASAISLGMAPIHFWMTHFLTPSRCTGVLLLAQIAGAGTALVRLLPPLSVGHSSALMTVGILGTVSALYFALIMFREEQTARATVYLYLTQVAILFVALGIGGADRNFVALHLMNTMTSVSGMLLVLGIVQSRIGSERMSSVRGCAHLLPQAAVCFLICALSLVGFPGTLGFLVEEGVFGGGVLHHYVVACILILSLGLNGYSSFRIFGYSFLGPKDPDLSSQLVLLTREKLGTLAVTAIIVGLGIFPYLLPVAH